MYLSCVAVEEADWSPSPCLVHGAAGKIKFCCNLNIKHDKAEEKKKSTAKFPWQH